MANENHDANGSGEPATVPVKSKPADKHWHVIDNTVTAVDLAGMVELPPEMYGALPPAYPYRSGAPNPPRRPPPPKQAKKYQPSRSDS